MADRAEVEQGKPPVGEHQDVARMRVGVEHPALGDLVHHAAQQRTRQVGPVEPTLVDQLPGVAQADPVQPFDDEHVLGAQLLVHGRKHHRHASDGTLLIWPGRGDRRHVARLHPEVELIPDGSGEPAGDADGADRARPAGPVLEADRQPLQDVQVLFHGGPDPGALNLNGYRRAGGGPAAQPSLVDLGDRCGRGRLWLQLGKRLLRWLSQGAGYHLLHLVPRRWFGPVLKLGEFGRELLWEQITAGGQQLAQLREGDPALLKGLTQR